MPDFIDDMISIEDMKKYIKRAEDEGASHIGIEFNEIMAGKDTADTMEKWVLEEE